MNENFRIRQSKEKLYADLLQAVEKNLGVNPDAPNLPLVSDFSEEEMSTLREALDVICPAIAEASDDTGMNVERVTAESLDRIQKTMPDLWAKLEAIAERHTQNEI